MNTFKLQIETGEQMGAEFILREGTDYGQKEYTLDEKHQQIIKQLKSENIVIVFDLTEESASIVRKEQLLQK